MTGKGPRTGCWKCGGAHFERECPQMMGKGARAVQEEQTNWDPQIKEVGMVRRMEPEPMEFEEEIEVVKWLWRNRPQEIVDRAEEEGISPCDMAEEMAEDVVMEGRIWKKKEWRYQPCSDDHEEEEASQEEEWQEVITKRTAKRRRYAANMVTRRWGKRKEEEIPNENVNYFRTVQPEEVMQVQGEWEEIDMAVDSGATETVLGESMAVTVKTEPGEASRRGVKYEVADGTLIENRGEKRFQAETTEGVRRKFVAQVTEVNKAQLSVSKLVQSGHRVVFDKEGSYVEDKESGEVMKMREVGGMYMLKMWIPRNAGF